MAQAASEPTRAEQSFGVLLKDLAQLPSGDRPTSSDPWDVQVRFEAMSSSTLAQLLSILLGGQPLRFTSSPSPNPAHSILFTDTVEPGDGDRTRVVVIGGGGSLGSTLSLQLDWINRLKVIRNKASRSQLVEASGLDDGKECEIMWFDPDKLQASAPGSIDPNRWSQLTRPDIFPPMDATGRPVPLWRVAFTSEAQFSASPLRSNEAMVGDMVERLKGVPVGQAPLVLDGTANCGADSIGMMANSTKMRRPFRVVAVEMDGLNHSALATNVGLYGYATLVEPVHANTLTWLETDAGRAPFDCMYFDPPWGGKGYKQEASVRLELGGLNVWELCRRIIEDPARLETNLRLIVIKGPYNIDRNDPALLALGASVTFKTYPVARNIVYAYLDCSAYRFRARLKPVTPAVPIGAPAPPQQPSRPTQGLFKPVPFVKGNSKE